MPHYLTAKEAAEQLNISMQTLYAYVSRGLIRSEPDDNRSRKRRYHAKDIRNLILKKNARSAPEKLAEAALHLGTPVTESALTLITEDAVYYRGHNAAELARTNTLEQVAALLWLDNIAGADELFGEQHHSRIHEWIDMYQHQTKHHTSGVDALRTLQAVIALAGIDQLSTYNAQPTALAVAGANILWLAGSVVTGDSSNTLLAEKLAGHWSKPDTASMLNRIMIVSADHELNVSSFTARVVASSGADLYAVVAAALSAFTGTKHGGMAEQVNAFFREAFADGNPEQTVAARIKRGEHVPGFGHPLYTKIDPRADIILTALAADHAGNAAFQIAQDIIDVMAARLDLHPNIDFAMSTAFHVLELNPMDAILPYVLGRICGWIGQAIEEYHQDQLIRPRATYIGRPPVE